MIKYIVINSAIARNTFRAMKTAKPILSLNQFMIRGQVLKQYRDFLRTANRLPDQNMKKVTCYFA